MRRLKAFPDQQCAHLVRLRTEGGNMTTCPECGGSIVLDLDVVEGEIVDCEECGAELEVVSANPIELDLAPEEEEDWGE